MQRLTLRPLVPLLRAATTSPLAATTTATIAFAIASNGGLASVSVARGSGSAALDRAAVSVIRKAAPFPRPPAGARRQYSIKIKGQ